MSDDVLAPADWIAEAHERATGSRCTVCNGALPDDRFDASQLNEPCICPYCPACGENIAEQPRHRCEEAA